MLILRSKRKIHFKLNNCRDLTISRAQMCLTNIQVVVFNIRDVKLISRPHKRRIFQLLTFSQATPTDSTSTVLDTLT
jgi:hypothetical protein